MRISDWSSDVCSSDLAVVGGDNHECVIALRHRHGGRNGFVERDGVLERPPRVAAMMGMVDPPRLDKQDIAASLALKHRDRGARHFRERRLSGGRSEARRGGKECVSQCSSRWSPYHKKKKKEDTKKNE